jgi:hypothetical protein
MPAQDRGRMMTKDFPMGIQVTARAVATHISPNTEVHQRFSMDNCAKNARPRVYLISFFKIKGGMRIVNTTAIIKRSLFQACVLMFIAIPRIGSAFTVSAPELLPLVERPFHFVLGTVLFDPFTLSAGHEEITRQALVKAAKALRLVGIDPVAGNERFLGDTSPRLIGTTSGALTRNKVISGNYCTDVPSHVTATVDLFKLWGVDRSVDWHTAKETQTLHFLRGERHDGSLMSAREACMDAQSKVTRVAILAAQDWLKGDKKKAAFLVGHATHIIQDSFSPLHTSRGNSNSGFALKDVCYFGTERRAALQALGLEKTICYHKPVGLEQDGIWISTPEQEELAQVNWPQEGGRALGGDYKPGVDSRELALKHEARLAREATVRFIYLLVTEVDAEKKLNREFEQPAREKLEKRLKDDFYNGSFPIQGLREVLPNGALNCEQLN